MFVCLCSQVEPSATGRSLAQRSPTDCGVCLSVIKWKNKTLDTYCEAGRRGKDYKQTNKQPNNQPTNQTNKQTNKTTRREHIVFCCVQTFLVVNYAYVPFPSSTNC
jgi:hypothetical protein